MTHPDRGLRVNNTEFGWTCSVYMTNNQLLTPSVQQHHTHSIASHRPVRPVRDPTRAVSPVPADEALAQTFCIALAALQWQAEALHVLLELGTDGDCAGHGAERKRVRLAPGGRATVAREGIIRCAQL